MQHLLDFKCLSVSLTSLVDGRVIEVNDQYLTTLGYTRDEVIGKTTVDMNIWVCPEDRVALVKTLLTCGKVENAEIRLRTKTGQIFTHRWFAEYRVIDGEKCIAAFAYDVTEQKLLEQQLQREFAVKQALAELSGSLLASKNTVEDICKIILEHARKITKSEHGFVAAIDPEMSHCIGYALTQMGQVSMLDGQGKVSFSKGNCDEYPGFWSVAFAIGSVFFTNSPHNHLSFKDVSPRQVSAKSFLSVPVQAEGKMLGQIALADAVNGYTDYDLMAVQSMVDYCASALQSCYRKKALEESEENYRMLFEQVNDAIFLLEVDPEGNPGRFRQVNDVACRRLGYSREELLGLSVTDIDPFLTPEDWEKIGALLKSQGVHTFERTHRAKDGTLIPVEISARFLTLGGRTFSLTVARDLTERKRSEALIRDKQKEELLQAENQLFTTGPIVAYKWKSGAADRAEYLSPNVYEQFGYDVQDFLTGKLNHMKLIHPEDKKRWKAAVRARLTEEQLFTEIEYRIRRADGEYRWVLDHTILLRGGTGAVSGCQGYILDITERKYSENALWESEKKYRELVEDAQIIIMNFNENGQVLFINEFGSAFFGYQPSELVGHSCKGTLLPELESTGRNLWDFYKDVFDNTANYKQAVCEVAKKDGRRVWIEWTNRFQKDATTGQVSVTSVGIDITAKRRVVAFARAQYERHRRDKILDDVIESRITEEEFLNLAEECGFRIVPPLLCCIVTLDFSNDRLKFLEKNSEEWQTWVDTAVDLIYSRLGGLAWHTEGRIVILHHSPIKSCARSLYDDATWVEKISNIIKDVFRGIHYAIGVSAIQAEIKTVYTQACEAVRVGPVFHPETHIHYWRDLGVNRLILEQAKSTAGMAFIQDYLGPLLEKPSSRNEEWLRTLKEIISGDSMNLMAARLHIHPKTLAFRKRKIEKLLQINTNDPEERLNIAVAFKLKQLQEKIQH